MKYFRRNIDYIGTRLHAGIRALQNSVRSFIIGIDNRAIEMANDCLPVLNQHNLSELTTLIKDYSLDLTIPFENINQWRAQFTVNENSPYSIRRLAESRFGGITFTSGFISIKYRPDLYTFVFTNRASSSCCM